MEAHPTREINPNTGWVTVRATKKDCMPPNNNSKASQSFNDGAQRKIGLQMAERTDEDGRIGAEGEYTVSLKGRVEMLVEMERACTGIEDVVEARFKALSAREKERVRM